MGPGCASVRSSSSATAPIDCDPWRALLHRWFVEYNPFYLVSAMLVLAGLTLVSSGIPQGSVVAPLAVALLTEIYAGSMVAGAALLARRGQMRSAVMLAVLAVAYQGDLTLHTETCAMLGGVGIVATCAWLVVFVLKLVALGRALRVRIAPRALVTACLGATGVAAAPYAWSHGGADERGLVLALFVGVLLALYPRGGGVSSQAPLTAWGTIVLRRTVRVSWLASLLLLLLHVAFWRGSLSLLPLATAVGLVTAVRSLGEKLLWPVTGAMVGVVALAAPSQLPYAALLASAALLLRISTRTVTTAAPATTDDPSPYRASTVDTLPIEWSDAAACMSTAERLRLLTGAWAFEYLGAVLLLVPSLHPLLVDVPFVALAAYMMWKLRARLVLAFVGAMAVHAVVAAGFVSAPRGRLEWGVAALALGFVLLFGSLAVSWRASRTVQGASD